MNKASTLMILLGIIIATTVIPSHAVKGFAVNVMGGGGVLNGIWLNTGSPPTAPKSFWFRPSRSAN